VKFSFSDRVEVPKHVLVRALEKESVLLNLEAECYFGLDEIGTRMWQAVTTAPKIDDAYAQLLGEFDIEAELLRQDLSEQLGKLVDHRLLLSILRMGNRLPQSEWNCRHFSSGRRAD
jgi:hypothetical protein